MPIRRCFFHTPIPHIYTCCMRYSGIEFKRNLVIINDRVLNLKKQTEMLSDMIIENDNLCGR